jgi:hypothetical protein
MREPHDASLSITIRRLVLPQGIAGADLGETIARALGERLEGRIGVDVSGLNLADSIATQIAAHPDLAGKHAAARERHHGRR